MQLNWSISPKVRLSVWAGGSLSKNWFLSFWLVHLNLSQMGGVPTKIGIFKHRFETSASLLSDTNLNRNSRRILRRNLYYSYVQIKIFDIFFQPRNGSSSKNAPSLPPQLSLIKFSSIRHPSSSSSIHTNTKWSLHVMFPSVLSLAIMLRSFWSMPRTMDMPSPPSTVPGAFRYSHL